MMEKKEAVSGVLPDEVLQEVSGGAGLSLDNLSKEKTDTTVKVFDNPTPLTPENPIDSGVKEKFD